MKTCYQWGKDHPLVSGVLLFFYLLYLFLPYVFSILFYSFPLVVCTAILLGGPRIRQEKHPKNAKKDDDETSGCNATSTARDLPSQISKRVVRKDKDDQDMHIISSITEEQILPSKNVGPCPLGEAQSGEIQMHAVLTDVETDDDEPEEVTNKAIQWTEEDQRNLIELGSSEIERNERLESLMEKRMAKKFLSMQPRRTPSLECMEGYYPPQDHHIDRVGPVMLTRRRNNRNPFDIPYGPQEERPSLRGGSFEEEFFDELLKDMPLNNHEFVGTNSNNYFGTFEEEPIAKSVRCYIPKPIPSDKPAVSRFKRESDVDNNVNEESAQEEEDAISINEKEENYASSSSLSSNRSRRSLSVCSHKSLRRKTRAKDTSEGKSLTCVVPLRKNKLRHTGKEKVSSSSTNAHTKMEERSYYISRQHRHHKPTCSIASDMQVEVSEAESSNVKTLEHLESFVYDGDVDRDVNSGDEDFWGTSPHPMRLGSFGGKSRLPDIVEDNNSNNRAIETIYDKKGGNGDDIIESRTSVSSSSSSSQDSQKGISQHLAHYLEALQHTEIDSSTLEVPSTSREGGSGKEITVQEEINGIFEADEGRGKPRRFEETEQPVTEKEVKTMSGNELEGEVKPDSASIIHEAESNVSEKGVTEINLKEVTSGSLSTSSHDDVADRSRLGDRPRAKLENEVKTTLGNQVEHKVEPESTSVIHARKESNDANTSDVDRDTGSEDKDSSIKIEHKPHLATKEDTNMDKRTVTNMDVTSK